MSNLRFLLLYLSLGIIFVALWNLGEFLIFGKISPDVFEFTLCLVTSGGLALIVDTYAYLEKKLV